MVRRIKNIYHLLKAVYWTYRCGKPAKRLYVIGVTGTDGKTTTCTLIYEILRKAGYRAGMMTTVSARLEDDEIDTGLHTTNPDPSLLQPILKRAVETGITHMVLEVTSHGLDQNRVWGCNFKIGVLTNISHEHLDYHRTMERYREAKLKLFENVEYAVLNEDDQAYGFFKSRIYPGVKIVGYRKTKLSEISPTLMGDYNKYNIAAAQAVAKILGIGEDRIREAIKNFTGVPGRREEVKWPKTCLPAGKFRVVVDFAHTPNALESVLKQLKKEIPAGKNLIAVFGATGGRDRLKRPVMGAAAARLADIVIVTSDDTRGENQDEIAREIISGIKNSHLRLENGTLYIENDRRKAIEMAVKMAKKGDIILLAGKGHEKSILLGKTEYPWSDAGAASNAIREFVK